MLSRVANSLYWMSRYIERAENVARILDVNLQLLLDFRSLDDEGLRDHWMPIVQCTGDQDSFVARGLLRELGAAAATEGGNGFAFGWLLRDEQARAEGVEADVDVAWAKVRQRARAVTG